MFEWLRKLLARSPDQVATLRGQLEEARLRAELRAVQATEGLFDRVDPREPWNDDGEGWYPIGGEFVPRNVDNRKKGEVLPVYLSEGGLKMIRDASRELCAFNGHAVNARDNRANYTVGKGLSYKVIPRAVLPAELSGDRPPDDQIALWCKQAQAVLDGFRTANNWSEREREAVHRCDEDGEAVVRLFHVGAGETQARFVEPEHVRSPGADGMSEHSFGVETTPGDVEDVVAYHVQERPDVTTELTRVDASEIVHLKLNVRSTAKRGYPTFWPVRDNLDRADRLLRNLNTLAAVRATYAAIVRRKHNATSISARVDAASDGTRTDPVTGKQVRVNRRLPGGVVETDGLSEYEFPGANLGAADYLAVYEAELRVIAARLNMPEYMLTANAANNNYACHDQETELLTRRGWLRHDQIRYGDEAATMNPETGRFEWQPVQAIHRYEHSGEMVRLLGRDVDALVTPNHRMLAARHQSRKIDGKLVRVGVKPWAFKRADELRTGDVLPVRIRKPDRPTVLAERHLSRVPYQGTVWCVTVPNGTTVTRRNGKTLVSGNSILVAESPSSKGFEGLQGFLFSRFGDGVYTGPRTSGVAWRVLENAVTYGQLPPQVLTYCQVQVEGPQVVVKDKYKETERARTLSEKGLLSDATWSSWETLDHDEEQGKRLREAEARRAAKEHEERTDKATLIDLQKAYYAGEIPREAAIATAKVVFSFSPADAAELFPAAEIPRPLNPPAPRPAPQPQPGGNAT